MAQTHEKPSEPLELMSTSALCPRQYECLLTAGARDPWLLSSDVASSVHAAGHCFYRAEEWWTYELCFKKAVRQYHKEAAAPDASDGALIQFSLGSFNAELTDADRVQVLLSGCWRPCHAILLRGEPAPHACGLYRERACVMVRRWMSAQMGPPATPNT